MTTNPATRPFWVVVGSGIDVRGIDVLGQIFDFSGIEKSEKSIKKTWQEFRDALSKGDFSFDDIASAKKNTFLRVYDDLFNKNAGIEYNTVLISEIEKYCVGRGTILGEDENPDFERFIPKTEFIKEDNRFSPSGVEWLYLAIGKEAAIHECAQAECRVKQNDRFGFCHFQFAADSTALKVVDLTIADEMTYKALNDGLETYGQEQVKKSIKKSKVLGFILRNNVNVEEFKKLFTKWGVYTYSKLLSEQIFEPLDEKDNKSLMYAPFQTMAQYYISLGYSKQVSDTQTRLTAWHEGTADRLGIEADESRRKRAGFDGVIHFIPGLFNDNLNFRGIEEKTASMITAQKAGHVCTHKIDYLLAPNRYD